MKTRAICTLLLAFLAATAGAQPASLTGGVIETSTKPLRELVEQDTWVGYRVPLVESAGSACCFDRDRRAGCKLNHSKGHMYGHIDDERRQPGEHLLVFVPPVSDRGRSGVHAYDSACPVVAGDLRIRWLGDIDIDASLEVLGPWAFSTDAIDTDHDRSALRAIAHHAGDTTTHLLATVARDDRQRDDVRSDTAFWLGALRGRPGYLVLRDLLSAIDRPSLRKSLVTALAQSPEPEAIGRLIEIARHDRSGDVRGNSLFWLAHTASERVPHVLIEAAERDPSTEVKKKAVFALSQLPTNRGTPLLIGIAERHASAAVRERAIFWLGQSKDPRALEFIVALLEASPS